jgi:hypothetical protein
MLRVVRICINMHNSCISSNRSHCRRRRRGKRQNCLGRSIDDHGRCRAIQEVTASVQNSRASAAPTRQTPAPRPRE